MTVIAAHGSVDRLPVLIAASLASATGAIIFNTLPIILGVLAETRGYDEAALGLLASAFLIGAFLAVVSALFWVDRLPWRPVMAGAAFVSLAMSLALPYVQSAPVMALSLGALGFVLALIYAPSLAAMGQATNTPRAFGVALAFQVGISAIIAFVLPTYLLAEFGIWSLSLSIGVSCLIVLLCWPVLPTRQSAPVAIDETTISTDAKPGNMAAGLSGLLAMGVFYVGVMGVWQFLDPIGLSQNLDHDFVGAVIAIALVIGGVGALIPAMIGDRYGLVRPPLFALGLLAASALCLWQGWGGAGFIAGVILLNVGWNLTTPFMYALLAESDASGRLIVLSPGVQTLGAIIGSASAGMIVGGSGYAALYVFFICITALAFAMHAFGARGRSASSMIEVC